MFDRCRILSPAKINLGLHVLSKRDDGYHDLETLFVAVDLYDELEFTATASGGCQLTVSSLDVHERDRAGFPTGEDNLIMRAVRAVERATATEFHLHITVTKRIPIAAGLGGGSSNAAATLRALSRMFDLGIDEHDLGEIAESLGSDVPFFLNGRAARATGRGEVLRPMSIFTDWWVVLMTPPFPLSTAEVYSQLNLTRRRSKNSFGVCGDEEGFFAALRQCRNDLEVVATSRYPVLSEYLTQLRVAGAEGAFVTGSGPTVVGVFRECPDNQTVTTLRTRNERVRVLVARPVRTVTALDVQEGRGQSC